MHPGRAYGWSVRDLSAHLSRRQSPRGAFNVPTCRTRRRHYLKAWPWRPRGGGTSRTYTPGGRRAAGRALTRVCQMNRTASTDKTGAKRRRRRSTHRGIIINITFSRFINDDRTRRTPPNHYVRARRSFVNFDLIKNETSSSHCSVACVRVRISSSRHRRICQTSRRRRRHPPDDNITSRRPSARPPSHPSVTYRFSRIVGTHRWPPARRRTTTDRQLLFILPPPPSIIINYCYYFPSFVVGRRSGKALIKTDTLPLTW